MNDLQVAKAIAGLEGVDDCEQFHYNDCNGYNPITNLALNCMLRDKHCAEIDYTTRFIAVGMGRACVIVDFESKEDIPRAVCECILKANGLWV